MQPAPANAPSSRRGVRAGTRTLLQEYLAALTARGAGNSSYEKAARTFLTRWPYPQGWASQPLRVRLSANAATRVLLNYLMLAGHLRPGYDYLLERKLPSLLREAPTSGHGPDLARFLAAAAELGYRRQVAAGMASQVLMRLLIQTGKAVDELTAADLDEFDAAISAREKAHAKPFKHYHTALYATGTVLYHLGAAVKPTEKRSKHLRWDWPRHLAAGALRPVPRRTRPVPVLAGRPGPAAPYRALPRGGGRDPQPPHRDAVVGLGAAQPDPHRRADDRRHHRVGVGRGADAAAGLLR
jgi:hypothetical protein